MTTYDENDAVLKQMTGSYFPVDYKSLQSNIELNVIDEGINSWTINGATIYRHAMNHPGSGSSYVIEADGAKIAYITDNELYPPYRKETDFLPFSQSHTIISLSSDPDARRLPDSLKCRALTQPCVKEMIN